MSAWIGPLGNLFEFKCPSAAESSSEDPHVYFRPLGGSVSATVLGDATRPRVWDVRVSAARPDHVEALEALASGQWGPGPFAFVPPAAEALNLLGKRDALAMRPAGTGYVNARPGTPVQTTEGVSGASYSSTAATPAPTTLGTAPVVPGVPVTGRAWVQAKTGTMASLYIRFYDAGGTQVGGQPPIDSTSSTTGLFLSSTATAPAGAAYAALSAAGLILARPSITWTADPRPWAPSAGSSNVVLSPLSNSVRRATGVAGEEQITDHAFTVTELTA